MEQSFNLINDFLEWLFAYGPFWIYLALLTASFIENVFPPFPGDFFTIAGGALAAAGWLNTLLVFLMVYVGGIGSTMVVYYLGRSFGRDFFIKKDYRLFSRRDIVRLEGWFSRKGAVLLVFSRFIVGARAAIALVSGIGEYNPLRMYIFSSISFCLFNGLLLFSSYIFVVNFDMIAHYYHLYEKVLWPVVIIIVILFIAVKLYRVKIRGE
jgi:membrane protein DedA with SNARE-associated domain